MKRHLICIALLAAPLTPAFAAVDGEAKLKEIFIEYPKPYYSIQMRRLQMSGTGVYRLFIDEQGKVTEVKILTSTRRRELDDEATKTFRRWRAKPGSRREFTLTFTFSMPVNRLFISASGARALKIDGDLTGPLRMPFPGESGPGPLYTARRVPGTGVSVKAFVADGVSDADASRSLSAWFASPHQPLSAW
jgi:TonB family protein